MYCSVYTACILLKSKDCWFNSFVIWQEHLIGLRDEGLEDTPKPLLVKDQTTISRLEKQAEEFLNAVLYRKGESWCLTDGMGLVHQYFALFNTDVLSTIDPAGKMARHIT